MILCRVLVVFVEYIHSFCQGRSCVARMQALISARWSVNHTLMFVALSTFTVANEMAPQVKEAFINRPHFVDSAPGFIRMQVLSPQENPDEIWMMTYWADEESYAAWYKNHMQESHQNVPKGLRLVPHSAKVRFFEQICE